MSDQTLTFAAVNKSVGQVNSGTSGSNITFAASGAEITFTFTKDSPFVNGARTFTITGGGSLTLTLKTVTQPSSFPYTSQKTNDLDQGVVGSGDIDVVPPN